MKGKKNKSKTKVAVNKKEATKKNNKLWSIKTIIIIIEIIILIIISKLIFNIIFADKDEKNFDLINATVTCSYSTPWIEIYKKEENGYIEQGKRKGITKYSFVLENSTPVDSEAIDTYKYTTREAYDADNAICSTYASEQDECIEEKENLTRTVKKQKIYYKTFPEMMAYDNSWHEEYIEELEKDGYNCEMSNVKK